ncbi:MAG TPA: DegT/DnrJ/EryC1/StrS family aminotransferase [Gemmatimonadaceae bacterium]|nr:DegT/DnrJ/EryC1/StrS family aminotransferase [Gemmatimonadaceae bacterium]HRQ79017.1 DegT/DnrJ/EryC1/StrS family aminotransferase [Gemmatimonadaceae bacterium]
MPLSPSLAERELAASLEVPDALLVQSPAAAMHLALRVLGVGPARTVLVSATARPSMVQPVGWLAAEPVLVDAQITSCNMDELLVAAALRRSSRWHPPVQAVVVAHRFGVMAEIEAICAAATAAGVPVIEDVGAALGAWGPGVAAGTFGQIGVLTLPYGAAPDAGTAGALVSRDAEVVAMARALAARPAEIPDGDGAAQSLDYTVAAACMPAIRAAARERHAALQRTRETRDWYSDALRWIPGLRLITSERSARSTGSVTALLVEAARFGATRDELALRLIDAGVLARGIAPPLHHHPRYFYAHAMLTGVADHFRQSVVMLPSGPDVGERERQRAFEVLMGGRA